MSQMSTVPVFKCRDCGAPVYVTYLSTQVNDPDGKLLEELMKGMADVARCKDCRARWNWYASQNRSEEYYKHFFDPQPVLLNIRQGLSEVDWYGRKS